MSHESIHNKKRQLRNLLLEKRDDTSAEYLALASRKIADRILASREFKEAKDIGAYYSLASEVSTQTLLFDAILERKKNLYLPRVASKFQMGFCKVSSLSDLIRGTLSSTILEPKPDAQKASKIDLLLVPAVAVSCDGHRLGYGRGYYDRYLAQLGKRTVGVGIMPQDTSVYDPKYDTSTITDNAHTTDYTPYDMLSEPPDTVAALVLEKQIVRRLPVEAHDVNVDMTITEKRIIRH